MNLEVPAPNTIHDVALDCPALHGTSYTTASKETFMQLCNTTYLGDQTNIKDIIAIISYSMDDCIEACSSVNEFAVSPACAGVTFKPTLSEFPAGNCWLKTGTGAGTDDWWVASAKRIAP